tara:strand:- start:1261 stop:1554 length:294 start_codon:yes stop_codon:yes gene_type:complete
MMDWEKAYHILEEYISWDTETKKEDIKFLKERLNMCDPIYRILKGATDETIKKALERLRKETGYGVPNDKTKKCESKRKKATEPSKRHIERSISQVA